MIEVYWNCASCQEDGMIKVSNRIDGPGMVRAAACDHARKSPECGYEFK